MAGRPARRTVVILDFRLAIFLAVTQLWMTSTRPHTCMREQINRGRLRAQIAVQQIGDGKVCIFCPTEVSERLYRHLVASHIPSLPPRGAIFGRYPQDELIVTLSPDAAEVAVNKFVSSLPEVCYERDVV